MGRATIVEDKGDGLYTVSLDYGSQKINADIVAVQDELASLQTSLDDLLPQLVAAGNDARSAARALDDAIAANNSGALGQEGLDDAAEEAVRAQQTLAQLEQDAAYIRATMSTLQGRLEVLQSQVTAETLDVWCTTFTEEATGVVGTIEINGEKSPPILVPECAEWTAADGLATNPLAMSPSATYLNAAILPGWQKFSPTYRVGIISDIDTTENTCTVALDDAVSSAQGLDINQNQVLGGVPIEYLDCNAGAFEEGDRVVVKFENQSWNEPKVIGFESNPRPCGEYIWTHYYAFENNVRVSKMARISQDIATIINTYSSPSTAPACFRPSRINNSRAAFSDSSASYQTSNFGRPLLKLPSGATIFSRADIVVNQFTTNEMEVNNDKGRLFRLHDVDANSDDVFESAALEVYSWPDGDLISTNTLPVENYSAPGGFESRSFYRVVQSLDERVVLVEYHRGFFVGNEPGWFRVREYTIDGQPAYVGQKHIIPLLAAGVTPLNSSDQQLAVTANHIMFFFLDIEDASDINNVITKWRFVLMDRTGAIVRDTSLIAQGLSAPNVFNTGALIEAIGMTMRTNLTTGLDEVILSLNGAIPNATPSILDDVMDRALVRYDALSGDPLNPSAVLPLPVEFGTGLPRDFTSAIRLD